ncbi:PhoX family phosphatase [Advenella sp. WQ 585]|uniref:PhoX family phosphatase n=1 Tax=Advenella mandrilli TaxID=2800330 RepID=A0ABS1EDS3_9BURK|nr:PhoX family phosphatase [Advenella mandrilli]MBK1781183.1 PhoX family phosphatase [Advenella mandrilli]
MSDLDRDDIPSNSSKAESLNELLGKQQARRGFLKAGAGASTMAFFGLSLNTAAASAQSAAAGSAAPVSAMSFKAVAASTDDKIVVPEGYRYAVINRWGDPLFTDSPKWKGDATDDAAAQARQMGDNHDGMHYFPINGSSTEGLMVTNHEYINPAYFFPANVRVAGENWNEDWVKKSQRAQGVSVKHIRHDGKDWKTVLDSNYNRSINALDAEMVLTGPAAGHALLKTNADPSGTVVFGTFGNCGNGYTLWDTYLTCEENVTDYFGTEKEGVQSSTLMQRYGVATKASNDSYRWETHDKRFDVAEEPNEWMRHGWIVEIDPFDPESKPRKLTALGHFKHENAAMTLAADKRVVVYMGDDQRSEYIYKFVSDDKFDPANKAANRTLLDKGTLYVARFTDGEQAGDLKGKGEWIALTLDTVGLNGKKLGELFTDQGELLVKTRLAADAVGATPMDRPEWIAVHPHTQEVYVTLTNNSDRGSDKERKGTNGLKHPGIDDANPRAKNPYGQIVRWNESGKDAAASEFDWDVFVLAGNPDVHKEPANLMAGTPNISAQNLFNSPDGLAFDKDGRLWIQTDGNFSDAGNFAGNGNNQMLVAIPETEAGKGEIRRFLVGPSGCEITGITWTPDYKAVFVNVQHPGEYGKHPRAPKVTPQEAPMAFSKWPMDDNEDKEGSGGRPRSATVVVWREDGGVVGA